MEEKRTKQRHTTQPKTKRQTKQTIHNKQTHPKNIIYLICEWLFYSLIV